MKHAFVNFQFIQFQIGQVVRSSAFIYKCLTSQNEIFVLDTKLKRHISSFSCRLLLFIMQTNVFPTYLYSVQSSRVDGAYRSFCDWDEHLRHRVTRHVSIFITSKTNIHRYYVFQGKVNRIEKYLIYFRQGFNRICSKNRRIILSYTRT